MRADRLPIYDNRARNCVHRNRILTIFAEIADWLRQLQRHNIIMALIEDLDTNVISIIYFEETAASKQLF